MENQLEIAVHSKAITLQSNPVDVIEDELRQVHKLFCKIEGAWILAETIDDVCKLSLTTIKVMDHRRKTLGLDNAVKSTETYLTPYDE